MKPLYSTPIAFRPMKKEPAEHHWSSMQSYKLHLKIMQTSKGPYLRVSHTIAENPMEDGVQWIKPPYLVGEKCYVREAWCSTPDGHVHYKATDEALGPWRSSVTMPAWAARRFVIVKSCEPIRIEDISEEDALNLGFKKLTKDNGRTWKFGIPDRDGLPGTDNTGWAWTDWEVDYKEAFKKWWHKKHPGKWGWRIISEEANS